MSNTLRNLGLAALFAVSASAFLPGQASALSSHDCSVKYKAAKAADPNTPAWNDFRKANCGADAAAAPDATAPAAAPAAPTKTAAKAAPAAPATPVTPSGSFMADCSANWKAMKTAKTTPAGMDWKAYLAAKCPAPAAAPAVTTAAATAPAAGAKMSMAQCSAAWKAAKDGNNVPAGMTWNTFRSAGCVLPGAAPAAATTTADAGAKMSMSQCSAAWKAAKAANTVPAGMTWNSFRSAGCSVAGAPAAATTTTAAKASIAPPEPTTVDSTPIKTVDKNGKPLSAGQIAAIKRIRACGAQWQQLKAANKIPAQIASLDSKHQWPQYWSMCNKQLKAKGM